MCCIFVLSSVHVSLIEPEASIVKNIWVCFLVIGISLRIFKLNIPNFHPFSSNNLNGHTSFDIWKCILL